MGKKLYVGNLTYGVTDSDLEQMFAPHGTVQSAQVIMDRDTGRSKGFGFVEMGSDQEAQAAIAALNGKDVSGRALTVNEAKPREDRGRGRGYGGGRPRGVRRGAPLLIELNGLTVPARNVTGGDVLFVPGRACRRARESPPGMPGRGRRARAGSALPTRHRAQPGAAPPLRPTADGTNEGGSTAW